MVARTSSSEETSRRSRSPASSLSGRRRSSRLMSRARGRTSTRARRQDRRETRIGRTGERLARPPPPPAWARDPRAFASSESPSPGTSPGLRPFPRRARLRPGVRRGPPAFSLRKLHANRATDQPVGNSLSETLKDDDEASFACEDGLPPGVPGAVEDGLRDFL